MLKWFKRNGVKFALLLLKRFAKPHTVVGIIVDSLEKAERENDKQI